MILISDDGGLCLTLNYFNLSVSYKLQMESARIMKATSYKELLKSFQQAETPAATQRKPKALQLKKVAQPNKQNQLRNHTQSITEKSISHQASEWAEEDVLKEYNHKRKDRQNQLSYNKFIAYATSVLAEITGSVPPQLLNIKLTYLQYLAAMKQFAFIRDTYQPSPSDQPSQLWNQLISNGQSVGVFILFISSVLNMKSHEHTQKYSYMWKKYQQLRYTRMQSLGKSKNYTENEQQYPFTPSISQRSRTLAASRSKSKSRIEKCLAQKSFNQVFQDSIENQAHFCSPPKESVDFKAGNRRSQILYKMAKQKSLQKRRDKKTIQVQYQKSIKQLTFHPKIHPNNKQKVNKNKIIQGEQDSIDRMIRGRIQRQVRKIIQQRGLPYNEKMFQRMKKERYDALMRSNHEKVQHFHQEQYEHQRSVDRNYQQPKKSITDPPKAPLILSVEVDEGRVQKLVIKQGECYKQVAAKFIKQFKLGQDLYQKLVIGIQNAMRHQLAQIDEDSFEEEPESFN